MARGRGCLCFKKRMIYGRGKEVVGLATDDLWQGEGVVGLVVDDLWQ